MDGVWTEVLDEGARGGIAFILVVALAILAYKAHKRQPLAYHLGVCGVFVLLWLADPPDQAVWMTLAGTILAGYVLEAALVRETPWMKRWSKTAGVAAYLLFFTVFIWRNDAYTGSTLAISGQTVEFRQHRLHVKFDRPIATVTLLADRYRDVTTWVLRTAEPNPTQIRLDGGTVFRSQDGDEITGTELALRISRWARVEPIIKYDPLSIEQGPPGVRVTARR